MTETERIINSGIFPQSYFDDEIKCDFLVDSDRKKIWAIEVDMLLEIDRICKKHNIQYYLIGGTLLGAVRHNGFIPWDDDIDICMPRDDYDRFLTLGNEFKSPYFFQTPYTDKGYFYSHAKIRNSNTSAIDTVFMYQRFNMGIFVDVLPLDTVCLDTGKEKFELANKLNIDSTTYMKRLNPNLNDRDRKRVSEYIECNPFERYETIHELAISDKDKDSPFYTIYEATVYGFSRCCFNKEDFNGIQLVKFENHYFPIPVGYDRILKVVYGDYMEMPPIEKRGAWHGNVKFYPDIPYVETLKKLDMGELEYLKNCN